MQLKTVGAGPLHSLMRHGHSARISYVQIMSKFGPYVSNNASVCSQDFCRDLLCSIGCPSNALKMGRTQIFFRQKNEKYAKELLLLDEEEVKRAAKVISYNFYIRQRHVVRIGLQFLMRIRLSIAERERKREVEREKEAQIQKSVDNLNLNDSVHQQHISMEPKLEKEAKILTSIENSKSYNALQQQQQQQTSMEPLVKVRSATEKRPCYSIRFDGENHEKSHTTKRTRCKLEGCKLQSYQMCSKCRVHLCTGKSDCFNKFHDIHEN